MAAAVPILAGIGGGAAAAALGASTAVSVGAGIATGVATASLMSGGSATVTPPPVPGVPTAETDPTPVDTSGATGGADTTINDVAAVQEDVATQADTVTQAPITSPAAQPGTAAGGAAEAAEAATTSVGPAEDEAIDFYEKGRRATILTRATGLLTQESSDILRPRRGLGGGLIA